MPNPYQGNDAAALYVDYFGSRRMQEASVHRLYRGGIVGKERARAQAEKEAYPCPPTVRRSQQEIDAYLQKRVDIELLQRQQRKAALAEELYPPPPRVPQLSDDAYAAHLKRLYADPLRLREQKEKEIERVFGTHASTPVDPKVRERETNWRPPSASVPRAEADNQVYLVSYSDYFADPAKYVEKMTKKTVPKDAERHARRLKELAKPRTISPRRKEEEVDPKKPPGFRVYRKAEL